MRFHGTALECAEIIAQLDAAHGYPRGYTQADLDSGVISRVGGGIHVPLDQIRTETISQPQAVRVDADGRPVDGERVAHLPPLDAPNKARVAKARVLRLLNRGSKEALVAVPGIGATRADAIIARRATGRMVSIEDLRAALPAAAVQALRDYALTKIGDEDADETGVTAKAVRK
jgi:hypothetical protein